MPTPRPRVLAIDDEETIRVFLKDLFDIIGVDADTAGSGTEGLGLLARQYYDLVLTDYVMPGMTGLQVIDVVKREAPQTAVALLSGSLSPDEVERLRSTGLTVLTKPISVKDFTAALARLLPTGNR